ncbi:MAG: cob(I)yrinic acid a,c-diamide adenosyltransferase [Bacteroidales bacterium]
MSKIYTKTGDYGETRLSTGQKIQKDDPRLEAYGTIDELISWLGMIKAYEIPEEQSHTLSKIQHDLFSICSHIACDATDSKTKHVKLPQLNDEHIRFIENKIDSMNNKLPALTNFILPGGDPQVASCHIARTICRRAERRVVTITKNTKDTNNFIISFLNRLSDYLFVLARYTARKNNIIDILWKNDV